MIDKIKMTILYLFTIFLCNSWASYLKYYGRTLIMQMQHIIWKIAFTYKNK